MLRFYGVPILASPVLSFPLNDERKSGFLPPSFGLDSRSGFQAAIPYYWNIAPNRDATFTCSREHAARAGGRRRVPLSRAALLRRGRPATCCRTTAPTTTIRAMRSASSTRACCPATSTPRRGCCASPTTTTGRTSRAIAASPTPRLLQSDLQLYRPFGDWSTYARVQRWQVLQTEDPTTRIDPPPYERLPQVGTRYAGALARRLRGRLRGRVQSLRQPGRPLSRAAPDRRPVPRARQHQPAVLLARLDPVPKVSFNAAIVLGRPAACPTAGAAPRA